MAWVSKLGRIPGLRSYLPKMSQKLAVSEVEPSRHSSVGRAFAYVADKSPIQAPPIPGQRYMKEISLAGHQEVSRCSTRGESLGMCNIYASAKHK